MRRVPTAVLTAVLLAGVATGAASAAVTPAPASGVPAGLPIVGSGPRPGPDVLYADPPRAPQLESTGVWAADPLLVSGATAYRDGEWLYQDYLYDDHGATGVPDPSSPYGVGDYLFSPVAGTATYPTDPVFAQNGADLVEARVKPVAGATAFRLTLNVLQDPERVGATVALGTGPAVAWPHGAGVRGPAELFLTWHGRTAELRDAAGTVLTPATTAAVDLERRQVTLTVPKAAWDPGSRTVRTSVGVGVWDPAAASYLAPAVGSATATRPGGGSPLGVALFNVGPRTEEPQPVVRGRGYTIADTAVAGALDARWWRERQQSLALARGDVTPFAADVDFAALAARRDDDSRIPTSGSFDRILASRSSFGQGLDSTQVCTDVSGGIDSTAACKGRMVGQLQPYNVYVPEKDPAAGGYGLTLLLHSLSANYNQYAGSANQRQLGERGTGSVVVTPSGRGPDGFYLGHTEADVFETWADVARHYPLDRDWKTSSGYSMGGFGTYRLLARWPDLFARGFSVVGIPGTVRDQLASLRHVPLLAWNGAADELVNVRQAEDAAAGLTQAGATFTYDLYTSADHLTLAANDEYSAGADFLGEARVDRDPAVVTYVVDPVEDNAAAGVVADHAYWLSGLRASGDAPGTVDVRSSGFGTVPGEVGATAPGAGVLTGGAYVLPFVERGQTRTATTTAPVEDRLVVTATGVSRVVIDPQRARVTCAAKVDVASAEPVEVVLAGCTRVSSAAPPRAVPGGRTLPVTGVPAALPALALLSLLGGAAVRRRDPTLGPTGA